MIMLDCLVVSRLVSVTLELGVSGGAWHVHSQILVALRDVDADGVLKSQAFIIIGASSVSCYVIFESSQLEIDHPADGLMALPPFKPRQGRCPLDTHRRQTFWGQYKSQRPPFPSIITSSLQQLLKIK